MMQHSETIGALAAALAKAQHEVENATKNARNPHFKNQYADLAEVLNTVRPVYAAHGVGITQWLSYADGLVTVETMLSHDSGEWMRGAASAPVAKPDPQGVGSAATYLRRYSLAAVCGIAQEDDDGQAASRSRSEPARQSREERPRAEPGGKATPKQLEYLDKLMRSRVFTDAERDRVAARIADGDRATVSAALEWAKAELDARKAVEAAEAEEAA